MAGDRGYLTIKGPMQGISRSEYEYPIPLSDAEEMLSNLCQGFVVEKQRYRVEHAGHCWEVDEFHGQNQGLIVAEVNSLIPTKSLPYLTGSVTRSVTIAAMELPPELCALQHLGL
ncbi:CYTH domain-containing protein [Synechococcus elongatus]|uniref:CYTH domain-containing protein n=1 Tax=Synechococcus elongatus TaxID=32046 RepID=UPI0030D0550B